MRVRKRKRLHRGRKGRHDRPINKTAFSLCLELGEGDANKPVVVGKYTQTKQSQLKGKIVKSGHGRRYKRASTVPRTRVEKQGKNTREKIEQKESEKSRKKGKDKKENKKQKRDNTMGMHQQVDFPLSPSKSYPFLRRERKFFC